MSILEEKLMHAKNDKLTKENRTHTITCQHKNHTMLALDNVLITIVQEIHKHDPHWSLPTPPNFILVIHAPLLFLLLLILQARIHPPQGRQ